MPAAQIKELPENSRAEHVSLLGGFFNLFRNRRANKIREPDKQGGQIHGL